MQFLVITDAGGTRQWVPFGRVLKIETVGDIVTDPTSNAAGRLIRNRITRVIYLNGVVEPVVVDVSSIAPYSVGSTLYEFGYRSPDGYLLVVLSNRLSPGEIVEEIPSEEIAWDGDILWDGGIYWS